MKSMLITYFLIMLIAHPSCRTDRFESASVDSRVNIRLPHSDGVEIKNNDEANSEADSINFSVMSVFRRAY